MAKLEPGQRKGPGTRRRWIFVALVVGSALAVLVVGTLFGVLGDTASVPQPTVRAAPRPAVPAVAAPAGIAPQVVRPTAAPQGDASQTREITTQGPDGTTTTVVSPDGTVTSTTTTRAPN
jgi:hypothetical protein